MDEKENCEAVVMPSRTLLLKGIPPKMNNSDDIHEYFSKFGALIWVNENYASDPGTAVVTFFSISDAIAAFMSTDPIMNENSIQKFWFEYTKKCDECPYMYSSTDSIKQHMALYHSSHELLNNEKAQLTECRSVTSTPNPPVKNITLWDFKKKSQSVHQQPKVNISADNELKMLKQKNKDLTESLNQALEQRNLARSEVVKLYEDLQKVTADKEHVESVLQEKSKRIEEQEYEMKQVFASHETVLKEKERLDNELNASKDLIKNDFEIDISPYTAKIDLLTKELQQAKIANGIKETDAIVNDKMQTLLAENKRLIQDFKDECLRLEVKDQDFKRVTMKYEVLLKEKEHFDCTLKDKKEQNKMHVNNELSLLRQENRDLKDNLQRIRKERDSKQSEILDLNERIFLLQGENGKIADILKEKAKHLEDKEMEMMRIMTKYEWLLQEIERVDSEYLHLKRQNDDLNGSVNDALEQRDLEKSEVAALNVKLTTAHDTHDKISSILKEKCRQLEAAEALVEQSNVTHNSLLREKQHMQEENSSLIRKTNVLNDAISRSEKDRNSRQKEVDTLNETLKTQRNEIEQIMDTLRVERKRLEDKELEMKRINSMYELLLTEKERVCVELNAKKMLIDEKDAQNSLLKRKNEMFNNTLCRMEKERDLAQIEIRTLNERIHAAMIEREKVIESLTAKSKYSKEMDVKFKELSTNYKHLLEKKERMAGELKEKELMASEIVALNQKNDNLNSTLNMTIKQRNQERSEVATLNAKLRDLQCDTGKVVQKFKDKCKEADGKEVEVKRFTKMYEMLLAEKGRLDDEMKAKDKQIDATVIHLSEENRKLSEELEIKEQLLLNIKSSFNILTPKKR